MVRLCMLEIGRSPLVLVLLQVWHGRLKRDRHAPSLQQLMMKLLGTEGRERKGECRRQRTLVGMSGLMLLLLMRLVVLLLLPRNGRALRLLLLVRVGVALLLRLDDCVHLAEDKRER